MDTKKDVFSFYSKVKGNGELLRKMNHGSVYQVMTLSEAGIVATVTLDTLDKTIRFDAFNRNTEAYIGDRYCKSSKPTIDALKQQIISDYFTY